MSLVRCQSSPIRVDARERLPEHLEPLGAHLAGESRQAGHVTAGSREGRDQPEADRIAPVAMTIGILVVAFFAARAAGCRR